MFRSAALFDAKLFLSFTRDRAVQAKTKSNGAVPLEEYLTAWHKRVIKNKVVRNKLPDEKSKAETIISNEKKHILSQDINQICQSDLSLFNNNQTKIYLNIKAFLDDFIENICFYEKQSLVSVMLQKKAEGTQLVILHGQEEELESKFTMYDTPIEELKTDVLIKELRILIPTLLQFIKDPNSFDGNTLIEEITKVIKEYKKKFDDIPKSFILVKDAWLKSLDQYVAQLIARIETINTHYSDNEYSDNEEITDDEELSDFIGDVDNEVKIVIKQNDPAILSSEIDLLITQLEKTFDSEIAKNAVEKAATLLTICDKNPDTTDWVSIEAIIDRLINSINCEGRPGYQDEVFDEVKRQKDAYAQALQGNSGSSGPVEETPQESNYQVTEEEEQRILDKYKYYNEANDIIDNSSGYQKILQYKNIITQRADEQKFVKACTDLEAEVNKSSHPNPIMQDAGRYLLDTVKQVKSEGDIKPHDLPRITSYLNTTTKLIKNPKDDSGAYHDHINNTKEAMGKNRKWGPIVGGALFCVLGALLIAAAVTVTVMTFGIASPLTVPALAVGGSVMVAGVTLSATAFTAIAGAGLATTAV